MQLATQQDQRINPIGLLFEFCIGAEEQHKFQNIVDGADTLLLREHLNVLAVDPNDTDSRIQNVYRLHIDAFFEAMPHGQNPEDPIDEKERFKSILASFHGQRVRVKNVSVSNHDPKQLTLSLFTYFMDRLRRRPMSEEEEKELQMDMAAAD